jgi:tetratricopeptide (TPR) repeat protein
VPKQPPEKLTEEPKIPEMDILYYPFIKFSPCDEFTPRDPAAKIESVVAFHIKDGVKQPLPSRLSDKHHESIMKAKELYSKKQYGETAALLNPASRDEPDNVFILNELARALFRVEESRKESIEKRQSFDMYRKLISLLDRQLCEAASGSGKRIVPVDMWFVEAYWKLGNLYMDRGEYEKAVYEITRGIIVGFKSLNLKEPTILDQAYSYLCEAYFHLGNFTFAKFFAEKAQQINPANSHVKQYLEKMKKIAPDSARGGF